MSTLRMSAGLKWVNVERWDEETRPIASHDLRLDPAYWTDRAFRDGAKELCVDKIDLKRWLKEYLADRTKNVVTLATAPANTYRVRPLQSSQSTTFATFADALQSATPADVIEWDSIAECCALDIDFHGIESPGPVALSRFAVRVTPAPNHWWITTHDGLRLVYLLRNKTGAEDSAALAAWSAQREYPQAGVELLTRTRGRHAERATGSIANPPADTSGIRRLMGGYTADDSDFAAWLEERSLRPGERYPHTQCPCDPSPRTSGNVDPVVVHDDHVYCYSCAAAGRSLGGAPGYFSAAALCGTREQSLFALCVRNLTHWEHARHVMPGPMALSRSIYGAALRAVHGADPRISSVFVAGCNLVRYDGHWGDADGRPIAFRNAHPATLRNLPTAQYVIDGEAKTNLETVERLQHSGDLTRYGYPPIVPLWGVQMRQVVPQSDRRVYTILHTPALRPDAMQDRRPRYVPTKARLKPDDAAAALLDVFPGLSIPLIKLLLAAKGCAESGGQTPMVFLSGPTSSGKSESVRIAAAIAGDHATIVPASQGVDRLRAGLLSAKKSGGYAFFDEVSKEGAKIKQDPVSTMESLLNFTPDSESHMLYVGPVALGAVPVCIWADTAVAKEIQEHAQIARRLIWVRLHSRIEWRRTAKAAGLQSPGDLRVCGSRRLVDAANAILSEVIDEWFTGDAPIFQDAAERYGFKCMEAADLAGERDGTIREFVRLVLAAKPLDGAEAKRFAGPGWKLIDLSKDTELSETWRLLCDPKQQAESRILDECDLGLILGAEPCRINRRSHGTKLVVRLESIAKHETGVLINDELGLGTRKPGIHGSGDTELPQSPVGWFANIPARFLDPSA